MMTTHGKAIYDSIISHPEEWVQENHIFKHKKSGVSLWTSNIPFINFSIYSPTGASWSWHDKFMIYRAVANHGGNVILQKLSGVNP